MVFVVRIRKLEVIFLKEQTPSYYSTNVVIIEIVAILELQNGLVK